MPKVALVLVAAAVLEAREKPSTGGRHEGVLVRRPLSHHSCCPPTRLPSPHQTDDHSGAGQRWRPAAFLLLSPCRGERTGVAHVVPGGRDPAVGTLDVGDAELVDMAVEGIGDAAHVPSDAEEVELSEIAAVSLICATRVPLRYRRWLSGP